MYDKYGIKDKYISTLRERKEEKKAVTSIKLFDMIAEAEEVFDEDLSRLSYEDAVKCLGKIIAKKDSQKEIYGSYINSYLDYTKSPLRHLFKLKDYMDIMGVDFSFISYEQIKETETRINIRFGDVGWMYNAIMFCIYYGFSDICDFVELRKSDIDFGRQLIRFRSGKLIDMADKPELAHYLKEVIDHDCAYTKSTGSNDYLFLSPDSVFKAGRKSSSGSAIHKSFYTTYFTSLLARKVDKELFDKKKIITKKSLTDSGFIKYIVDDIPEDKYIYDYINAEPDSEEERFLKGHASTFGLKSSVAYVKKLLLSYDKYVNKNGR